MRRRGATGDGRRGTAIGGRGCRAGDHQHQERQHHQADEERLTAGPHRRRPAPGDRAACWLDHQDRAWHVGPESAGRRDTRTTRCTVQLPRSHERGTAAMDLPRAQVALLANRERRCRLRRAAALLACGHQRPPRSITGEEIRTDVMQGATADWTAALRRRGVIAGRSKIGVHVGGGHPARIARTSFMVSDDVRPQRGAPLLRPRRPTSSRNNDPLAEHDPLKCNNPGDDLFSRKAALSVSSALESLTSVFGMGTGVASPLESPGSFASGR